VDTFTAIWGGLTAEQICERVEAMKLIAFDKDDHG
jgi:hypothetical protein